MKIFAETERLILREITNNDLDGMFKLDSNPEVHKYLGKKPINTKEESQKMIDSIRQQYKERGIGRWAIINKRTNEFMGWTGLKLNTEQTMNDFSNFHDIGYRLLQEFWGQGYATESAIPAIAYAFQVLKLKKVYGITEKGNEASHKILIKLGLHEVETFHHEPDNIDLRWYEIQNPSQD